MAVPVNKQIGRLFSEVYTEQDKPPCLNSPPMLGASLKYCWSFEMEILVESAKAKYGGMFGKSKRENA